MVRRGQVRDWLIGWLAGRVNEPPGAVDPDRTFDAYGLRSRDLVELSGELGELLDRPVDPQAVYSHPTITLLAAYCAEPVRSAEPSGGVASGSREVAAQVAARPDEAVAVVGLGCRFPGGAHDPAGYAALLLSGRSGTRDVPAGRWGDPGRTAGGTGGYLDCDIAEFDADFFAITPREAAAMDPQQRLVLEVTQEALEHAGLATRSLAGSRTGVFIGASTSDYSLLQLRDPAAVDAWTATGSSPSILANRVSHLFGLRGPSMVVDTACSSSLVAVHLAVRSLRSGESDVALAGGVNLIISPAIAIGFDQAGVMARDGRCKTFDAAADGYGRGEGCGMVVLKRLSDAVRNNDRVLAVVRGSAVNSDGATNGLMAPNPAAQESVLRDAYAAAGVDPREVDYVEAHGTGTLLGDPIEANALGAVLGAGRRATRPLLIGSVKSNLGHLEAAAGIAGLIKVVLALSHRRLPAGLHFRAPNPHIRFDDLRLRVVTAPISWPRYRGAEPPVAGVSSFGFGGTNAHVVLEAAAGAVEAGNAGAGSLPAPAIFLIGGSRPERLADASSALLRRLDEFDALGAVNARPSLTDIGYSLARRDRTARAAVLARTADELREGLGVLAKGGESPRVVRAPDEGPLNGPVWVFSGQGSQWPGMGRRLLKEDHAFADAVAALDPLFVAEAGFSLRGLLESGEAPPSVDRIQPVLFGMQVALARTWEAMGIRPAAVFGHSMGEVAAAVVAGALSCEHGLAVIARRSRLLLDVAGHGTMASLDLAEDEVLKLVAPYEGVEVAVRSSPHQTVIAGGTEQVRAVVEQVTREGGRARLVAVDYASHSSHIDPIQERLVAALADVRGGPPAVPFYGTVLEDPREVPAFDAAYWAANLRRTVRFSAAVAHAADDGFTCFVEVSPHPLLLQAVSETLEDRARRPAVLPTLIRDRDEAATMRAQAATILLGGRPSDPDRLFPGGRVIDLPTTAWRRARHWIDEARIRTGSGGGRAAPEAGTLLGERVDVPGVHGLAVWQARLGPGTLPYPGRHSVGGVSLVPASVLVHTALRAAPRSAVATVRLLRPVLPDREQDVQVTVRGHALDVHVRPAGQDGAAWLHSMTADLLPADATEEAHPTPDGDESATNPAAVQSALSAAGVEGNAYPWQVTSLSTGTASLTASIVFADGDPTLAGVLDAALSIAPLAVPDAAVRVPARIDRVSAYSEAKFDADSPVVLRVVQRPGEAEPGELVVDISAEGPAGHRILGLSGVRYASLQEDETLDMRRLVHTVGWRTLGEGSGAQTTTPADVTLLGPPSELADLLRNRMQDAGATVRQLADIEDSALRDAPTGTFVLLPHTPPAMLDGCRRALHVINTLAERHRSGGAVLWLVTDGVQAAMDENAPAAAALWGLAKVAAAEYPHLRCAVADLSPGSVPERAAWLARLLLDPPDESVVVAGDEPLVPAVRPAEPGQDPGAGQPLGCAPDAGYLITGGLGALGLRTAQWLADRGARRLVLAGRTGPPPRHAWDGAVDERWREPVDAIRRLERQGVAVRIAPVDVADSEAVARLLADLDREGHPPIRGVVHAAGVLADRMLADTGAADLEAVLQAKAVGASVLHRAFPPGTVDFFVLFSSAGTLAGVPGQGAYAAANASLDALAHLRRNQGCAATSINWGVWDGLGFGRHPAARLAIDELRAAGLRPLRPGEAFAGWDHAHRVGAAQAIVVPVTGAAPAVRPPGLLGEAVAHANAPDRSTETQATDAWAGLAPAERRSRVEATITAIAADVMGMRPGDVEPRRPLAELGLDSIMALMIRNRAERAFGLRVPATALWNHPTIDALTTFLDGRLADADDPSPEPVPPPEGSSGPAARGWNDLLTHIESAERS
ncbi:SDR family NAD(P)-dependent oxidoreductase [Actinomadura sp. KC216]|uniref:type I polyketide synthase n=1 Tax=Actinomadura sp. KC216 TaxID=2530370 RepID=UPI00104D7BA8|nr:type I polyketide synthase [Actinomadura sp. KC216]TDB91903.1 SDR family NAD(P)-dependent oxidoreductase [Actinomadura sp. KC216]